jgi:F0F1-type ATP synthase membrane subunit b/b'
MPQLDFSMYASQGLWMIGFFCLLWAMLAIFVTPKIADIQEQRKRKIHEYVRKAEQLNRKAQSALEKYEATIAEAQDKAKAEMEDNQKQIKDYLQQSEAQMSAKLNQKIASSEFLLAKEKQETMQQIEDIAETLAFQVTQKLGFKDIAISDIQQIAKKENS